MSEDTNTVVNTIPMLHWWTWGLAMNLFAPLYFLWALVRESFLVGLVTVYIGVPISFVVAIFFSISREILS